MSSKPDAAFTAVEPYLFFGGRCEEALASYRDRLGAEIDLVMRFRDSPEPPPPEMCPPEHLDKVMHAEFRIGTAKLNAADGGAGHTPGTHGFALTLTARDDDTAERTFASIAAAGRILMPIGETFFATRFGMVVDPFGVTWMVMVPKPVPTR